MPVLRDFQRKDVAFLRENGLRALVASAPGTGKTAVSITATVMTPGALPALVVCPASVTENWEREIKRWSPGAKIVRIEGMRGRIPRITPRTFVVISWALLDARWATLRRLGFQTIIADEAHFSRNSDTLRSQALFQLTERAKHVLLLSGTPIVNDSAELQALYRLLGSENPPMVRRLLEDVAPDIPPKTRSTLRIELRPKDREEYDRANEDFEAWLLSSWARLRRAGLDEAAVDRTLAAEALAKIGYLRRIVGGAKVYAAAEWIDNAVRLGEPVVVFVEHQATLKRLTKLLKRLRIRFGVIEGSTSAKQRQEIIDGFQRNDFPVFIGTKAAKEGITLTAARNCLFVERFFTSADEEQAEDRIRRIGQRFKTTIWYLHAVDTVDDRMDEIVRAKRKLIREAIGNADIHETSIGNTVALLKTWQNKARPADTEEPTQLGMTDRKPRLPLPREVHAIVFRGARWNPRAAMSWCKMNGFAPQKHLELSDRFKIVVHPADLFRPNEFRAVSISTEIQAIIGKRLGAARERQIRQALKRAG